MSKPIPPAPSGGGYFTAWPVLGLIAAQLGDPRTGFRPAVEPRRVMLVAPLLMLANHHFFAEAASSLPTCNGSYSTLLCGLALFFRDQWVRCSAYLIVPCVWAGTAETMCPARVLLTEMKILPEPGGAPGWWASASACFTAEGAGDCLSRLAIPAPSAWGAISR